MRVEKECRLCRLNKPLIAFGKNCATRDGLRHECRACISERNRARYASDPARKLECANRRYAENGAEIREKNLAYRAANGERVRAIGARSREKRRESIRQKGAAYRRDNPEQIRAASQRMRAKRRSAPGSHTAADILKLLELQRAHCAACRASIEAGYHVDHVEPLSRGGANDRNNLQLLCAACNRNKSARDPLEFMQSRGFLL